LTTPDELVNTSPDPYFTVCTKHNQPTIKEQYTNDNQGHKSRKQLN